MRAITRLPARPSLRAQAPHDLLVTETALPGGGHAHAQAHARQAQLVAERVRARNHQAARPALPARTGSRAFIISIIWYIERVMALHSRGHAQARARQARRWLSTCVCLSTLPLGCPFHQLRLTRLPEDPDSKTCWVTGAQFGGLRNLPATVQGHPRRASAGGARGWRWASARRAPRGPASGSAPGA